MEFIKYFIELNNLQFNTDPHLINYKLNIDETKIEIKLLLHPPCIFSLQFFSSNCLKF